MTTRAKPTPDMWSRLLADRIRRMRLLRRISTQQLADGMARRGFPILRSAISQIENGYRKSLTVDELVAFAAYFGVTITALLDENAVCDACRDDPPIGYRCLTCGMQT